MICVNSTLFFANISGHNLIARFLIVLFRGFFVRCQTLLNCLDYVIVFLTADNVWIKWPILFEHTVGGDQNAVKESTTLSKSSGVLILVLRFEEEKEVYIRDSFYQLNVVRDGCFISNKVNYQRWMIWTLTFIIKYVQ